MGCIISCNPAINNTIQEWIASQSVFAMYTTHDFSWSLKTFHFLALRVYNLTICVNQQTSHAVVNNWCNNGYMEIVIQTWCIFEECSSEWVFLFYSKFVLIINCLFKNFVVNSHFLSEIRQFLYFHQPTSTLVSTMPLDFFCWLLS